MARRLTVVAPAQAVKDLRAHARIQCMSIYVDGKYLKLKWGVCAPVLSEARRTLPEGSFEVYRSTFSGSFGKEAYKSRTYDAVRIKIK